MNAQNTTISSNDNSSEPSPEAVARVVHMLYSFFDGDNNARWKDDIRPSIQADGVGLVAVAAAQDAHKRIGGWEVVRAMFNTVFLLPNLAAERAATTMGDPDIALASRTIRDVSEGLVDTSDQAVFDEIYDACARPGKCSLFGYCLLQIAVAALNVGADDQDPFARPVLNIANEIATRVNKGAALEFAASLRREAARAARAA